MLPQLDSEIRANQISFSFSLASGFSKNDTKLSRKKNITKKNIIIKKSQAVAAAAEAECEK